MVIDPSAAAESESVFALFAQRARHRAVGSLRRQLVACAVTTGGIMLAIPSWWPVAAALAASACYAAWGIADGRGRSRVTIIASRALAAFTTVLTIGAVVGLALAAFTGDAPSPKGTCYDANERAFACDAKGQRR